jgi:hypothetical protein
LVRPADKHSYQEDSQTGKPGERAGVAYRFPRKTPPPKERNHHVAHPGPQTEEGLVEDRVVLCDCHCAAMYHTAVSIMPEDGFVMCWVSDCGRYYGKSLGYFHLRTTVPTTLERIDRNTRRMTRCQSENCTAGSPMAITHSGDASSDEGKMCWYCFECGTELPYSIPRVLRRRPPRSSGPVGVTDDRHRLPAKL